MDENMAKTLSKETLMDNATKHQDDGFEVVDSGFGEPWKPEKQGETLEGFYTGTEVVTAKRGDPFRVWHVRMDDGTMRSVSGANLIRTMERVKIGARVRFTFNGMVEAANGKMKDYTVRVAKGGQYTDAEMQAKRDAAERPAPKPGKGGDDIPF